MLLIKIGGGKNIDWDNIAKDIADVTKKEKIILVHGASAIRDEIAKKLSSPTKIITSPSGITSVYTDQKALDVFLMVYAGLVNKKIVANLHKHGVNAVGLSGIDGKLWQAKWKKETYSQVNGKTKLISDNLTGRVEKVNTELIDLLLKNNYLPVMCPPAISFENQIVNTDNDWAISIMASALKIEKIIVLFEAPGLLKNIHDQTSVIKKIRKEDLDDFMKFAQGRMKKKILGAKKAFELGLREMYWGDARIKQPITRVLEGNGTIIS